MKLTPIQRELYGYLRHAITVDHCPPTRAEIAKNMGWRSSNAAEEALRRLETKGVIRLHSGRSRGIELTGLDP